MCLIIKSEVCAGLFIYLILLLNKDAFYALKSDNLLQTAFNGKCSCKWVFEKQNSVLLYHAPNSSYAKWQISLILKPCIIPIFCVSRLYQAFSYELKSLVL